MQNIRRLTSKRTKILYTFLYFTYILLILAYPVITMRFIDNIVSRNEKEIILYASLAGANFILVQVCAYFFSVVIGRVEAENFINFFKRVSEVIKYQDMKENEITMPELTQHIGKYYDSSSDYFFIKKVELVFSILNVIAIFVIMFFLDWRITLLLMVFVPVGFLISKKFEKKLYRNSEANLKNNDLVKKFVLDQNILTKEERFAETKQLTGFDSIISRFLKDYRRSVRTKSAYLYFFSYSLLNFLILMVILLSGYLSYRNILTIGALFAFQNYTSQLWQPADFLMSYSSKYQEAKPSLLKLEKLMSYKTNDYKKDKINSIVLNNYSALDMNGVELFKPLNVEFRKGEIYLVVGENGSGKTTMIESILGFNSRYKGEILINDTLEKYDDLVYIPSGNYISSFFDETKSKGSNGEKKLAQIYFYLNANKSVFILDEPTNFIDVDNKSKIYKRIKNLSSPDRIVIVISHDREFEKIATSVVKLE